MSADYLFMQDKLYDVQYDTGDKVIQCGRHNDIFKLWLQWRAKVLKQSMLQIQNTCGVSGNVARRGEAEFLY